MPKNVLNQPKSMEKDKVLMIKSYVLKILSKIEVFSLLTGGKDRKNSLNLNLNSDFAQITYFDDFLTKYFFIFGIFFDCHFLRVAATEWSRPYTEPTRQCLVTWYRSDHIKRIAPSSINDPEGNWMTSEWPRYRMTAWLNMAVSILWELHRTKMTIKKKMPKNNWNVFCQKIIKIITSSINGVQIQQLL